ncbi:MAG: flagellar export chaperone FliS [Chromatiales bacterium]|jgi:flagellar protein FliS|nr:flagellar export chaperone FliS [Chromatiales bacterium]
MNNALRGYRNQGLKEVVESATPHALIQMMMGGVLDRLASARGCMERGDIAGKGEQIGWAISIIDGLRVSLDKPAGGELAENLEQLYRYMMQRLLEANTRHELAYLDEVAGLLRQIKSAWDAIPAELTSARSRAELGAVS